MPVTDPRWLLIRPAQRSAYPFAHRGPNPVPREGVSRNDLCWYGRELKIFAEDGAWDLATLQPVVEAMVEALPKGTHLYSIFQRDGQAHICVVATRELYKLSSIFIWPARLRRQIDVILSDLAIAPTCVVFWTAASTGSRPSPE